MSYVACNPQTLKVVHTIILQSHALMLNISDVYTFPHRLTRGYFESGS